MAQATMKDVRVWQGKTIIDRDGGKVGTIDDVYFDAQTGRPEWALINTGIFGTSHLFVPLTTVQDQSEHEVIRVEWTREHIKDAPSVEAGRELSESDERSLYDHYGLDWRQSESETTYAGHPGTTEGE